MAEKNIVTIQGKHIMAAKKFASCDDKRPVLMGVKLEANGGKWKLVATDSYKLVIIEGEDKIAEPTTEIDIVVPPEALIGLKAGDRVSFEPDGDECKVTTFAKHKSVTKSVRLMDGKYPSYQQLIPSGEIPRGCYRYAPCLSSTHMKAIMQAFEQSLGKDAAVEVATLEDEALKPTMMYGKDDDVRIAALLMPVRPDEAKSPLADPRPKGKAEERNKELREELKAAKANVEMWKGLHEKAIAEKGDGQLAEELEKVKADAASLKADLKKANAKAERWVKRAEEEKAKRMAQEGDGKVDDRVKELEAELKAARKELDKVWKENASLKAKPKEPAPEKPKADTAAEVSLKTMEAWCEGKGLIASQKREGTCIWVEGESTPYREELTAMGFRFAKKRKSWYFNPAA